MIGTAHMCKQRNGTCGCFFMLIQGRDTLVVAQNVHLRKLTDVLKSVLNISAVTGIDMLLYVEAGGVLQQCVLNSETLIIRRKDSLILIEDCSNEFVNDLSGLDSDTRLTVLQTVSKIM